MPTVITRKLSGKNFTYFKAGRAITDKAEIKRIRSLVIPPAWQDVEIASDPTAKIQASGIDTSGKKQAIYSATFREQQDNAKFERILRFADRLPSLRRTIEKDMRRQKLSKEKVLAVIVKLIDEAYFRPGNDTYAQEHQTYGITTMRSKHLEVTTTSVTFDFVGKSHKKHHKVIKDAKIARVIKQLDELPGYNVFRYIGDDGETHPISSDMVNGYIKTTMGDEFSAKDFRTWGGTMIAVSNLALEKRAKTDRERKKSVTSAVKAVAKKLGNTPAVARSSYIDPRVIEAYLGSNSIEKVYETIADMKPHKYLKNEERAVVKLLSKAR